MSSYSAFRLRQVSTSGVGKLLRPRRKHRFIALEDLLRKALRQPLQLRAGS